MAPTARGWRGLFWLCLAVGIGGYLAVIGLLPPPPARDPGGAAAWLAGFAPVWLVLWLIAGVTAGAVGWRRRGERGSSGAGSGGGPGDGPGERHRCPECGEPLSLRREREGARKGQPYWVCREHGRVD